MTEIFFVRGVVCFFVAINMVAFGIMFFDKMRAKKKKNERISEGMLFFLAIAFGSIGVICGMYFFRHKTQKWYFRAGMPLAFLQNIMTLYAVYILFAYI